MKASIQLRLGQHLTMTPQLQQAIRLLQLSTLDLKQEIQDALDSNLMLETDEDSQSRDNPATDSKSTDNSNETEVQLDTNTMPEELPVDTAWEDIYDAVPASTPSTSSQAVEPSSDYLNQNSRGETLQEHLSWQMELTPFSDLDREVARNIIDGIDDDGYLKTALEDIISSIDHPDIEIEEVEAVLHRIQSFDPPGVGARDLQESLLIQLRQQDNQQPLVKQAITLVSKYFDLLAQQDEAGLRRKMKIKKEALLEINELIRSLNPRPGTAIESAPPAYIEPDIFVSKRNGAWRVELNPDIAPKLRVNNSYANMIRRADNSSDNVTMKDHLQEARWFIKSLQSRNDTLLRVASRIVEIQQQFFEHGDEAMKPLVLRDIADALEMHESTISRVTTNKFMYTPRGTYEFKYFFSSHVSTANGGEASATAIRALIKKLIAAELPNKPLSDNKIATILEDQGIQVARRTVAKYRESMAIPPSNERKRLA